MIHKPFQQIEKNDIEALMRDKVPECRTLDYKRTLPGNSDAEKRELLADISSFANSAGGDLLFGVSEQSGVPNSIQGISSSDSDAEIQRIDSILRNGIEPRLPNVQMRVIDGFPNGPVLLVRVPKSWMSPHMVTFKGSSRFFARNNAGKYQLDVGEIRTAFEFSDAIPKKIGRFRDERLARIVSGETPVPIADSPKMILHLIPVSALFGPPTLETESLKEMGERFKPFYGGAFGRFNLDGYVTSSDSNEDRNESRGYCQVFRTGIVESVDARSLLSARKEKWITTTSFEGKIIDHVGQHRLGLQELEVPLPIVVILGLTGVKGYKFYDTKARFPYNEETEIDRDLLLLPDVLMENYDVGLDELLRPMFDALWNAAGWPRCLNYDEDGNRIF